jgi:trehalose 6-phosphate phosphatase
MIATTVMAAKPALRARLEPSGGLLVCLDFDGTLAPIAESPSTPRITQANDRAVRALSARPDTRVAIISGRALDDLVPRVGIDDVVYAGNHGLELSVGDEVVVHPAAAQQVPTIQRAREILEQRTAAVPGAHVENKRLSLTLHYRQVPANRVPEIERAVESFEDVPWDGHSAEGTVPFRIVSGKQSMEIRPDVDWDKGAAVTDLQRRVPVDWRTAYVGDDTTDEDAFQVLDEADFDVFVGTDRTAARYRIPEQEQVAPFLSWLHRVLSETERDSPV